MDSVYSSIYPASCVASNSKVLFLIILIVSMICGNTLRRHDSDVTFIPLSYPKALHRLETRPCCMETRACRFGVWLKKMTRSEGTSLIPSTRLMLVEIVHFGHLEACVDQISLPYYRSMDLGTTTAHLTLIMLLSARILREWRVCRVRTPSSLLRKTLRIPAVSNQVQAYHERFLGASSFLFGASSLKPRFLLCDKLHYREASKPWPNLDSPSTGQTSSMRTTRQGRTSATEFGERRKSGVMTSYLAKPKQRYLVSIALIVQPHL